MEFIYLSIKQIRHLVGAAALCLAMLFTLLPTAAQAAPMHRDHGSKCAYHHKVVAGESLSTIAVHYGVSQRNLANANSIYNRDRIYAGQRLCIPSYDYTYRPIYGPSHVVQKGESLSTIAKHYGVSVRALAKANQIYNRDVIYAGQKLRLPH